MLIDQQNVFSNSQAIVADAVSTNVINLGAAGRAPGNPLEIVAFVTEAFNTLTSMNFIVQTSVDEAFTSPIDMQTVNKTLANLALGKKIDLGQLLEGAKQYVRLKYDVVGTDPTTGKISAFIAPFGDQTLVGQA